jgi:hypothetical protein
MKIASILKLAPLGLVALLFLAINGFAAPDEEALGKAEGYPVCPRLARKRAASSVWSATSTRCFRHARSREAHRPERSSASQQSLRSATDSRARTLDWTTTSRGIAPRGF